MNYRHEWRSESSGVALSYNGEKNSGSLSLFYPPLLAKAEKARLAEKGKSAESDW